MRMDVGFGLLILSNLQNLLRTCQTVSVNDGDTADGICEGMHASLSTLLPDWRIKLYKARLRNQGCGELTMEKHEADVEKSGGLG